MKGHLFTILGNRIKACKELDKKGLPKALILEDIREQVEVEITNWPDKKGLPKALILEYIKEQEEADMRSNKSKNDHPIAKTSSKRPPSGFTKLDSPHPLMPMPLPFLNQRMLSLHEKRPIG